MKKTMYALFAAATFTLTPAAQSAELNVSANDTVESVLKAQKGRVTVRLRSGQELTGTVRNVSYGTRMGHDLQFYRDIPIQPTGYGQALSILCLSEALRHIDAEEQAA